MITPIHGLLRHGQVREAFHCFERNRQAFTDEHIRICEIPAPPFHEAARGAYLQRRFHELGLVGVHSDAEGNVIGFYPGASIKSLGESLLVVSAHLDTVFPPDTDVTVKRAGSRFCAPGIADNCAGLAALLALIESLNATRLKPFGTIAFVATVGEEGEGNLRGVRHLFSEHSLGARIHQFISFDGPGTEYITHQALGSKRYRISLAGPGGHSWGDFGVVNPVHALGRLVAKLADYPAPLEPRTAYNAGRIEGGESVNVIPEWAHVDIDLRSVSELELARLEEFLLNATQQAIQSENRLRAAARHALVADIKLTGHRPSGETPRQSALVQTAVEASIALGIQPRLNRASTDSNIPISLGIPAITIGVGGMSADSHRLSEWYDPTGRELGYQRALLLMLGMTGIA
ncbi:MAG: M20/M25/M40 family metallo-hydrolase [Acidobacteria bacterium]|nr:M20/M25/M40 family metallo-hydrolase [Acidobacteriota bacterium]